MWASFIVGVGLTTGNMIAGFVGTPLVASPINCGALAMVLSLVIVPVVSLFTKPVPFEVDPPHAEGAIDREYVQALEAELERMKNGNGDVAAGGIRFGSDTSSGGNGSRSLSKSQTGEAPA